MTKREHMKISANELEVGDYIKIPGHIASLHRVPIDKTTAFSVGYMVGKVGPTGTISYTPDELVEVVGRWPFYIQR